MTAMQCLTMPFLAFPNNSQTYIAQRIALQDCPVLLCPTMSAERDSVA